MKEKKVKRKLKFKGVLIIYSFILGLFMIAFLIYVGDSLIKYEKNQTEKYIADSLTSACKKDVCNVEGLSNISKSEYDKDESIASAISELIKSADLKYEQTLDSSEENPIYDVYANDKLVLQVELTSSKKINRLGLLSFYEWKTSKITSKVENGFYTYTINAPSTYKVYVNEKEVTDKFIKESAQDDAFAEMAKYVTVPHLISYEIPNLYSIPEVVIKDENDNNVEYETKGTTITKSLDIKKYEDKNEALEKIENAPEILNIAENWSLFLTQDLSGTLYGFYTISKYLINDSELYKYAKSWATGIDITFTSRHTLENPIFTNERLENFEIYNENAFSCEVYLEKNMIVRGSKHQDVMHDKLYFVRMNNEWKLVKMQAITEGNVNDGGSSNNNTGI